MTPVRSERHALCDTLLAAGPEAPTLCEGWTALDLAVHLVLRENRPDLAVSLVLPVGRGRLRAASARAASRGLDDLVAQLRQGPPRWSPTAVPAVDAAVNLTELVVHHEDVRRALGMPPRSDVDELQDAVWEGLRAASVVSLRGSRMPLVVVRPDGRRQVLRPGVHPVVLTGEPVDLLLRLFGRTRGVEVELGGPGLSVTRFEQARQGV